MANSQFVGAVMTLTQAVYIELAACTPWFPGQGRTQPNIMKAASLAISVCSAAIARMFAKSPTEALSAVRGHFPSADDLYNIYFYSCDCIDLNRVGPAVIYLTV